MYCHGVLQGDSGGPLSIQNSDSVTGARVWVLAGIVSWGPNNSCGERHSPGVYTRSPVLTPLTVNLHYQDSELHAVDSEKH